MSNDRVRAFRDCLLNTCVRAFRGAYANLTLSNCLDSEDFRAATLLSLDQPLFTTPIEPAMKVARRELIREIEEYSGG